MTRSKGRARTELPPEAMDQIHFVLKEEDLQAFSKLLDRPERDMSDLAAFLARPSVLDEPDDAAHVDHK